MGPRESGPHLGSALGLLLALSSEITPGRALGTLHSPGKLNPIQLVAIRGERGIVLKKEQGLLQGRENPWSTNILASLFFHFGLLPIGAQLIEQEMRFLWYW